MVVQYHTFSPSTEAKLLVKCYFRVTKQIYLKMSCENCICMHLCIQRNSKPVSFTGTKVSTNGTHHWKVNMCLTLFEEIWLQNNSYGLFKTCILVCTAGFSQLQKQTPGCDVSNIHFQYIWKLTPTCIWMCDYFKNYIVLNHSYKKAFGDLILYNKSDFCLQSAWVNIGIALRRNIITPVEINFR